MAVLDGTGFGPDGTIWGGEILALGRDPLGFDRAWHLPQFPLAGGDSAVFKPWKAALGLLFALGLDPDGLALTAAATPAELALVRSQLASGTATVLTSSAGRLFDAVASLLNIRHQVTYEAQAAAELEVAARRCEHAQCSEPTATSVEQAIAQLVDGIRHDHPTDCLARGFHANLAHIVATALLQTAAKAVTGGGVTASTKPATTWATSPNANGNHTPGPGAGSPAASKDTASGAAVGAGVTLGLTGGVFQNRLFAADVVGQLNRAAPQANILTHRLVPPNDGGLALGQALAGYLDLLH
jgi:hydrogenase maturation protein HypF